MAWFRFGRSSGGARGNGSAAPAGGVAVADRAPATSTAATSGAVAPSTGVVDFAAPPPPRGAWLLLPPLHVLQGPPLVLDHHFETKLASWQNPMYGLKPLGHIRSPEAPSGTVLVRPMPGPVFEPEAAAGEAAPGPAASPEQTPPSAPLTLQAPVVRQVAVPTPPARPAITNAIAPEVVTELPPLPAPDPGFVAAMTEPVREFPHSHPRYEEDNSSTPVSEGTLRTLGERDDARLGGLQLHLVPQIVHTPEPAAETEPLQAPVQATSPAEALLPLVVPPAPQVQTAPLVTEAPPLAARVRIGE